MTITQDNDAARFGGRYAASVTVAAATAAGCGLSVYEWLHADAGAPLFWAASAVVTGFAATALTVGTEKTWRRLRRPQWPIFRLRDLNLPTLPKWALPAPSKRQTADKMTEVKMEAPKSPGTPQTPGQIERERRRKAREAEVNETPGKFGAGMPMPTGFLHNLHSTVAILREFVPSFKSNLTDVLDSEAPAATRIAGAVSIGVKTVAAVVVAYFVYLEGLQLRSAAYKSWADSCIERQKNAINFSTIGELYSGTGPDRNLDKECATR